MISSKTIFLSLNEFEPTLIIKALKFTRYSTKVHIDYVTSQALKEPTQRMEASVRGKKEDHSGDDERFKDTRNLIQ
jgi:hypothetical protein